MSYGLVIIIPLLPLPVGPADERRDLPSSPFSVVPAPDPSHVVGDIAVADPLRFANATPIAIPIVITIANPSDIVISPQRARLHPPCPPRFPPHFRHDPLRPPTDPDPLSSLTHLPPTHIYRPAHPRPAIPLRGNRPRPPPDAVVGPVRVSGRRACGRGSNRGGTGG